MTVWRRVVGSIGALGVVVAATVLAPAPASAESIAEAKAHADAVAQQLTDLREQSASAIVALEHAEHELGVAVGKHAQLERALDAARATAGGSSLQLQRRVSALYRAGGSIGVWASLLRAKSPSDFAARVANVEMVVASDADVRDDAQDSATRVAELEQAASEALAEKVRAGAAAEELTARLDTVIAQQQQVLDGATQRVRDLVEAKRRAEAEAAAARLRAEQEAARRAAMTYHPSAGSDPSRSIDIYAGPSGACPVGPVHTFTDTWHAPRSGGRQHKGTDVFAPFGAPMFAVVDGVIERWTDGGLGGLAIWLRGDNGDKYYYAHNAQNIAPPGTRVRAGQLIGYVGNTGNAATTPSHIHFQAHPGGGAPVNPYPWLAALCGH